MFTPSLYIISPVTAPSYWGTEVYRHLGLGAWTNVADLSIATVASLAPKDFQVEVCDQQISEVDFEHSAQYIGITGKFQQLEAIIDVARRFRERGKVVIIGGPLASLDPNSVRSHCDILVRGELEPIADQFFSDLRSGDWRCEYGIERAELVNSLIPRWDLYPNQRAFSGNVQTSRGCPFQCEFCDIVAYSGRKQRYKPPSEVLRELEVLHEYGYRHIMLSDDNFAVNRRRVKELLNAIIGWNRRHGTDPVTFNTQISMDFALDDELISLCSQAGIVSVYVGVETPNEESLKESNKLQNLSYEGVTLLEKVEHIARAGMMIEAGMMVGFDADGPDIFERQLLFAQKTPIATFTLYGLAAPLGTPLYERMLRSNRLVADFYKRPPLPWEGNVVPAQMTRKQFLSGMKWLANNLYALDNFKHRMLGWIDLQPKPETRSGPVKDISFRLRTNLRGAAASDFLYAPIAIVKAFMRIETNASEAWRCIASAANAKSISSTVIFRAISIYLQTRYILRTHGMWDTSLYSRPYTS